MKGIFGRFRAGPRADDAITYGDVQLESIDGLISERERMILQRINSRLRATLESTTEIFDSIRSSGRGFLEAEVSKETRGRTHGASQKSKDTLGRKLLEMSGNLQSVGIESFDDLLRIQKTVSDSLFGLVDVGRAYARHLIYEFPIQLRELNSVGKDLGRISKEIDRTVDENREVFTNLSKDRGSSKRLLDVASEIASTESTLNELDRDYRFIIAEGARISEDLLAQEPGVEFKKFKSVQQDVAKLKLDLLRVRVDVEQQFASMIKPLRKMRHLLSLDDEEERIIDQCLEGFWTAVLTVDEELLSEILKKLLKLIEKGAVEVKRETKVMNKLEALIRNISSVSFRNRYRAIEDRLKEKRNEAESAFARKIRAFKVAASDNKKEQDKLLMRIEGRKRVQNSLWQQVESQIPEIEAQINEYGLGHLHVIGIKSKLAEQQAS